MHEISDGQRRRVQIVLGLLEPWNLLLLDEVTVDLDVIGRSNLLKFLKDESEQRMATILYATHIFDGLSDWPTDLLHLSHGTVIRQCDLTKSFPELEEVIDENKSKHSFNNSPLLTLVEKWLREELEKDKAAKMVRYNGKKPTKWDLLSDNMKQYGDKYYNYWG